MCVCVCSFFSIFSAQSCSMWTLFLCEKQEFRWFGWLFTPFSIEYARVSIWVSSSFSASLLLNEYELYLVYSISSSSLDSSLSFRPKSLAVKWYRSDFVQFYSFIFFSFAFRSIVIIVVLFYRPILDGPHCHSFETSSSSLSFTSSSSSSSCSLTGFGNGVQRRLSVDIASRKSVHVKHVSCVRIFETSYSRNGSLASSVIFNYLSIKRKAA